MSENPYSFELPKHHKSIIKVIGVGGGGSNAVNHMYNQGIRDVEFVVCNTDVQALLSSPVPGRLQIGTNLTEGLGAGANPEKGRNAALESKEEIRELLSDGTKMVFITAGMGGGTGTGAAPIIAKVARELDLLTVGIVTMPFGFEGKKKMEQAEAGINELKQNCDTLLVILNDKLREVYGNLSIRNAFAEADNVLTTAAKGIAEIITVPGYVNVDFEDVKTVMMNSGTAVMGSSHTEGEGRARRAAEEALNSPLLNDKDILGADKVLLSIVSGEEAELQMDELSEITDYISEMTGEASELIFGHGIDPDLGESIRVTVIATGFDRRLATATAQNRKKVIDLESSRPAVKVPSGQIGLFDEPLEEQSPRHLEPEGREISGRTVIFDIDSIKASAGEGDRGNRRLGPDDEGELLSRIQQDQREEFEDNGKEDLAFKKLSLLEQARRRVEKLKGMKQNPLSEQDFRDKWETPAYVRRRVNLQDVPHSSDKTVSRYNLNDDSQIVGNNRFLHDNVD
jgi:cell division protein FtsZ